MENKSIIFLDIDGVLNCQTFYVERQNKKKKKTPKGVSAKKTKMEFYSEQICKERIKWLNGLCEEVNAVVVISSSWRLGKTVERLREVMKYCGGTFEIIDKTSHTGYERGTEISLWLRDNIKPETHGCHYYDFKKFVIIDDDSDMLLRQQPHFFQTDNYSGLTPTTCYKIKRFLTGKTF